MGRRTMVAERAVIEDTDRSCPDGLTDDDVTRILRRHFYQWMRGQTGSICDGFRYNHGEKRYEQTACHAAPHGLIVYPGDMERYLLRWPVID